MKAIYLNKHGSLDEVRYGEAPEPEPRENEVLIEVLAAGLNHLDLWVCREPGDMGMEMPHIIGSDAAGVVLENRSSNAELTQGREVILYPGLSCGRCRFCRRNQESLCDKLGIIGVARPGTFAEQIAVPAANVFPKPDHLSLEEAGVFSIPFLTAWRMIQTKADIVKGETVLVHGIGGGVAQAALAILKSMDVQVIATSSSNDKLSIARRHGADHTVNYTEFNDLGKVVLDITDGRGVDAVIDSVGAATLPAGIKGLRKGGRLVICGVTSGAQAMLDIQCLYWNQLSVMGSTLGSLAEYIELLREAESRRLRPVIDSAYTLEQARDALERLQQGDQYGNIVLKNQK